MLCWFCMIKTFLKVWNKWLLFFKWLDNWIFCDYHMRSTLLPFTHKVICVVKFWSADQMCKYLDVYCSLFFTLMQNIKSILNTDEWKLITNRDGIFFTLFKKSIFWLRKMQLWGESEKVTLIPKDNVDEDEDKQHLSLVALICAGRKEDARTKIKLW